MAGAAQLLLLCCLLQGGLCQNWASFMPQSLEGLSGSCLMIPCTFSIIPTFDQYLDDTCVAIWNTGGPFGQTVFNSGLTGQSTNGNTPQGNLTGNLRAKNCTTVFHNMSPKDKNTYYFRVQCNNKLKYSFPTNATIITITDSLPKPAITPPPVEVEEGDPVRLECSAVAPCPLLPPALTWTPAIGDVKENQQSASVTSVLNFTASRLHNGQRLQCSALYRRQAGHSDLQYENNLTLHILYPPNNTSVSHSGPVIEGTSVNLTCSTDANPAVDEFTWYKVVGDQVVAVGFHALLSTNVSETDSRFFCQVSNRYGSQNSSTTQIDVQFPPKGTTVIVQPDGPILEGVSVSLLCKSRANPPVTNYTWYKDEEGKEEEPGSSLNLGAVDPSHSGLYRCKARNDLGEDQSAAIQLDIQCFSGLHPLSLLIGPLVGAIGTLLVCGLMLLFFFRQGKIRLSTKKRSQDNVVVETSSSNVSVIYDNKAILEENEEESLHYASLDFAKLKDNSRGELGEEEGRGLASKTSEYAEVRLSSRGSNGGHTTEEETEADVHQGEGMLS